MDHHTKNLKKTACTTGTVIVIVFLPLLVSKAVAQTVLVEAESFENLGGWVIDQQFMDLMGSPFLLAHGLGEPVKDATTTVRFPAPGNYRVWVRTRDWVAPWKAPGAPGKFQLLIDGKPLETIFGTEGATVGIFLLVERPLSSLHKDLFYSFCLYIPEIRSNRKGPRA